MAKLRYRVSRTFYSKDKAMAVARQIVANDLRDGFYDYELKKEGKFDFDEAVKKAIEAVIVDEDGNTIEQLHSWEW